MLWVLVRIGEAILTSTHTMFLWRNKENYPQIILKYPPYLFHCPTICFFENILWCEMASKNPYRHSCVKSTTQTINVYTNTRQTISDAFVLFCLICGFTSQSTNMVMLRWSVKLTTLFLDRLPKWLTSNKCTSFHQ